MELPLFAFTRLILLLTCLTGCLGPSKTAALTQYQTKSLSARDTIEPLEDMNVTKPANMPTTGSATFHGAGRLVIDPDPNQTSDDIRLVGDSTLTADFGKGRVTGSLTNLSGVTDVSTVDATPLQAHGEISLGDGLSGIGNDRDGQITDRANEWYADYGGQLTFQGETILLGGIIVGDFRGNRTDPIDGQTAVKGMVGYDRDGTATLNGQPVSVTLVVSGK